MIEGRIAILWPRSGWHAIDSPKVAADLVALGFDAVSIHDGLVSSYDALAHIDATQTRRECFEAAGLRVAVGLGFPKPTPPALGTIAKAIVLALAGDFDHVQLDWEGSYDGHKDDARQIVDDVLGAFGGKTPVPCTSLCWWAPKTLPNGHGTHPSAPTDEFLRLTADDVPVCPQAYNDGQHDGETAWQLAWSRKAYAPRPVVPTIQGYRHSIADRVALMRAEPSFIAWDYFEMDGNFRAALTQTKVG